ncbi:choice-of-anchor I domain-containing protein, partial [Acetobacter lovaniensis]|uniref:choice-of-anchor I domain-containing protein n=1 Tax=Acetobacter lovaniensis TaxID=104100 RepID=UPI00376F96F2
MSIIDISHGIRRLRQSDVVTADFKKFNNAKLDPSIRIFGPNATVAQDLEPEYIAVSKDSKEAWVTPQENNAIAHLDLK